MIEHAERNGHELNGQGAYPARVAGRPDGERPGIALSPAEQHHLAQFEKKVQMVRDRTAGVARGFTTGFFLHGPGGVSKSHTVLGELERLQATLISRWYCIITLLLKVRGPRPRASKSLGPGRRPGPPPSARPGGSCGKAPAPLAQPV